MSFIDSTYLNGEIAYPNLSENATMLSAAITQYEKEILISALGYKLYSLLIADCTNFVPATQKYKDLVNGVEFQHESITGDTITLKWEGLKNTQKQSLIAYYVYYKLLERETIHLSDVGTLVLNSEGGERVSPYDKMIMAWDRLRELYGIFPAQMFSYYGNIAQKGEDFSIFNDDPSLFNFMYANKDDYSDWRFKPVWVKY